MNLLVALARRLLPGWLRKDGPSPEAQATVQSTQVATLEMQATAAHLRGERELERELLREIRRFERRMHDRN